MKFLLIAANFYRVSVRTSVIFIALALLSSCGSDSRPASPPLLSITISPMTLTLDQGATHQFSATVSGSTNTAVKWSILEGSLGGAVDAQGVYTAPASAGTYHVIATSNADSSKFASAQIQVNAIAIIITPPSTEIEPGGTQQFAASVTGSINPNVLWSVIEGEGGGTITKDGSYTAPAVPGSYHILATSALNRMASVTATITVATLAVSVSPRLVGLTPGTTRSFMASVAGCTDDRVTWIVHEGTAGGTITADGLYTAPGTTGEYHVVATSIAHPSISTAATIVIGNSGFSDAGSMTISRYNHTATLLANGDVLLVGGGTGGSLYYPGFTYETASAEVFDHSTGKFSATGSMSTERQWHTATLLPDGKVLIAGGGIDGGWDYFPVDSEELYDPATGQFTPTGKMHTPRLLHTATLLGNGKVLIVGGYSPMEIITTAELYDPATGTFSVAGPMREGRVEHIAALLPDGRVLLAGGWGSNGLNTSAEIYDPETGTFSDAPAFNRYYHAAVTLLDGRVLLAGGYSWDQDKGYEVHDNAQFFSLPAAQFSHAGNLSNPRFSFSMTRLMDGRVLLAGGFIDLSNGYAESLAELFDPSLPGFQVTGSMSQGRSGHQATLLQDGRILVTGGTLDASAEFYVSKP